MFGKKFSLLADESINIEKNKFKLSICIFIVK